ncbi:hypothetical protein B0J13DRAFT_616026 [Dactylonectria estremocensis]|uniref:Uncharacterized protein n=1 Tax=Dactylonectria estremocensis TaxID=1079267 RepID=A0A9P9FJH3_9HYPO|nr:hypothetical protein B0J13DRAFT_616026 [Dactylonectria estremocensis]
MAETNKPADSPNQHTPLYAIPRGEPAVYDLAGLADAQSSSGSSGHSYYTFCNRVDCECASQRRPETAPQEPRPPNPRVRSAPPPLTQPRSSDAAPPSPPQPSSEEAATSSESTGSDRHGPWHFAEYNVEYAAWRAIERRRVVRVNSQDSGRGWRSWFPCFPRPASSNATLTTLANEASSEARHGDNSREPVLPERMAVPARDNGNGNDESHTMNFTCSFSRYVIKYPTHRDQPPAASSSSMPRARVATVESAVDSSEE